ncbi:TNF receptor-associated factor 2-like [Lingula anatina]|uniref:TNF receptor-associated factor 2-like n=1 Tax=Lingula anatina TaxID=7574 RepID=A0A1S3H650_LINAN|nr:TNF receptor-associated factor 2-like [Lingula anatina]|eukprot:XP_013381595.1 TNF receptor-associated factor 2-like [Lingula anatina]
MANFIESHRTHHGYKTEILTGESQLDPKFLCPLCKCLLKKPVQNLCGHRFCAECLREVTSKNEDVICPACEGEDEVIEDESLLSIGKVFPDVALIRDMAKLDVTCPHSNCQWSGKFGEMQKHEDVCPQKPCEHPQCKGTHPQVCCPNKKDRCQSCGLQMTLKQLQSTHPSECPKACVTCSICESVMLRENFSTHLQQSGNCGSALELCAFGCTEPIEKDLYDKHKCESAHIHLDKLRVELEELTVTEGESSQEVPEDIKEKLRLMATSMNDLDDKIGNLKCKVQRLNTNHVEDSGIGSSIFSTLGAEGGGEASLVSAVEPRQRGMDGVDGNSVANSLQLPNSTPLNQLKSSLQVIDNKVATFEGIMAVLDNEVEKCSKQLENFERERRRERERIDVQERNIKSLERAIALKDVALAEQDLRIQALELAYFDGTMIWKIDNFARRREDAIRGRVTSMYSPCFYTSRTGYKLCCRIYLNGDGMGKGSHVSLFFVVMRGQNDSLLRWPFQQKVTFMMIDQNNREHVLDAFRPDPTSSSFKRPTSEMNIASGCPLFCPLSHLQDSRHAYVKDDTMFIRIIVDCSGL